MGAAEEFISKFHGLEGVTLGERKKNFFKLVHENASLKNDATHLNAILANLKPNTYLEHQFYLDFLIYFRRTEDILNLLKEGDEIVISKIAKQTWFFQNAFNNVEAGVLVNQILPTMSYSIRVKVLRKLSRDLDAERFNGIFDAVAQRYGIFLASKVITGCTAAKIREVFVDYPVELNESQLKILYKKDRDLIAFYFTRRGFNGTLESFFKFLFAEDWELYCQLQQKYKWSLKLGRRETKQLVKRKRDDIVNNPKNYVYDRNLKINALLRKLGKDATTVFRKLLPPTIGELEKYDIRKILKHFPKKYHYDLYFKTVEDCIGEKFIGHPQLIDEYLLNLMPNGAEKIALARVKVADDDDNFIKFLPIEESVPSLKRRINLTSDIQDRCRLLEALVETCAINKDRAALLEVIKYFSFRHKNEKSMVHLKFLHGIKYYFNLRTFDDSLWTSITDLLSYYIFNYDTDPESHENLNAHPLYKFHVLNEYWRLAYLEYLFLKNQPIDELLDYYIKTYSSITWDKSEFDIRFEKYFFNYMIENYPKFWDKDARVGKDCQLIYHIDRWNRFHLNEQLSFYNFPRLVESFNSTLDDNFPKHLTQFNNPFGDPSYHVLYEMMKEKLREKIFTTIPNDYKEQYTKLFWKYYIYVARCKDMAWFLKVDPEAIVHQFETFMDVVLKDSKSNIWWIVKKLNHLQLDAKCIQFCLEKLSTTPYAKTAVIKCLSILQTPEEFDALAQEHQPKRLRLDLNESSKWDYDLQSAIAKYFGNTKSYKHVPTLLQYCVGDYLKFAIGSLQSMLHHTPEVLLKQHLEHLSQQAISVKKEYLFMTCALSTVSEVEDLFKDLQKSQNESLQKHLFGATLNYFVKNPSDSLFELVKQNMRFVKSDDTESLKGVVKKFQVVPEKYKSPYICYCWDYFEEILPACRKLFTLRQSLLELLQGAVIKILPFEFIMRIIDEQFLNPDMRNSAELNYSVLFNFLIYQDDQQLLWDKIFSIINACPIRRDAILFYQVWWGRFMDLNHPEIGSGLKFVRYWEEKLSFTEDFSDCLRLFFLKLKIETTNPTPEVIASKVAVYLEELITSYGGYITHLLTGEVNTCLQYFTTEDHTIYHFYNSLLTNHKTVLIAALTIEFLPYYQPHEENLHLYYKMLRQIENFGDPTVRILFRNKFKDISIPKDV